MMRVIERIFGSRLHDRGDAAYDEAMKVSGDLLRRMRETSGSTDAARALMADIWQQNHNVPFMTTVYESVQEAKSGAEQKPEGSG